MYCIFFQEEVETLRATVDFNEEQMAKAESQLMNANSKIEELSNSLKVLACACGTSRVPVSIIFKK